jgi:hypothetical protein
MESRANLKSGPILILGLFSRIQEFLEAAMVDENQNGEHDEHHSESSRSMMLDEVVAQDGVVNQADS